MRAARALYSNELLCQLLHLPEGSTIIQAKADVTMLAVEFIIDNGELAEADVPHDAYPTMVEWREPQFEWGIGQLPGQAKR